MGIKKNFAYSSVLTIAGYIFPLITFPYVSRILGVENIGICNFVDSTVQYFSILATLGITSVGIREISKVQGNKIETSKVFSSLLVLSLITTLLSISILLLLIWFIPQLAEHKELFYVGVSKILMSTLMVEWLYKGIEDFKYITHRSLLIRFIYVILVFILIKDKNDFFLYYVLTVLVVIVNAIINLYYTKQHVIFSFTHIKIRPYLSSFIILGVYQILTSMYTSFNVTFLGISTNEIEVGYYTTATKLYTIIIIIGDDENG